jgi:hypothetical protein
MQPLSPPGRLHLDLQLTSEEVFEPDAVADAPLVRFIAYGDHHRIFGWIQLRAERLTDLLDAHEELLLADFKFESLEDGISQSVEESLIGRRELIAVQATGPRGDASRRHLTRTHPITVQSGNYLIAGYLHADPGVDPAASIDARGAMMPLTDARIEYWSYGELKHRSSGTIIVNREKADRIRIGTEEDHIGGGLRGSWSGVRPG